MNTLVEGHAKHDAAIRDLIVVSRTLVESTQRLQLSQEQTIAEIRALAAEAREERKATAEAISELRDAQKATGEKLHILIETVDRIIRNQGK